MRAIIFFVSVVAVTPALALPQYGSLFEARYKYRSDCSLCHVKGSEEVNAYGKAFILYGANIEALKELEKPDIDKDGFLGRDEIQARSNPGDPLSTPKQAGKWLKKPGVSKIPTRLLRRAFPDARKFTVLERPLTELETMNLEKKVGKENVEDIYRWPVVFVAHAGDGIVGGASYIAAVERTADNVEVNVFLLCVNPNGRIMRLDPVHVRRSAFLETQFLKQFNGAWPDDLWRLWMAPVLREDFRKYFIWLIARESRLIDIVIPP
ncbi:MAG: hypothetical protein AABZ44_00160 [Elusimicrobiota bacterium]